MRRYHVVSGVVFSILAIAQLTRTLLGWTVQIAEFTVPVWLSGVWFLLLGGLAVWAFRSARDHPSAG